MNKLLTFALLTGSLTLSSVVGAGAVGGPKRVRDTVMAHHQDSYVVVFEGKDLAIVRVSGDGSSDLDCMVYDNGGNLIKEDSDSTDQCVLIWEPAWTGKFKIVIRNTGTTANEYTLSTN